MTTLAARVNDTDHISRSKEALNAWALEAAKHMTPAQRLFTQSIADQECPGLYKAMEGHCVTRLPDLQEDCLSHGFAWTSEALACLFMARQPSEIIALYPRTPLDLYRMAHELAADNGTTFAGLKTLLTIYADAA